MANIYGWKPAPMVLPCRAVYQSGRRMRSIPPLVHDLLRGLVTGVSASMNGGQTDGVLWFGALVPKVSCS